MAFVSVTRLRLRSLRFAPPFVVAALRSRAQARRADGFLGGSLLGDRKLAFWTMTTWQDQADMRRYMTHGAHRTAMPRLAGWCDEGSSVHWHQDGDAMPDWHEADRRMRSEGRPVKVGRPSANHHDLTFDAPRIAGAAALRPKRSASA